LLIEKRTMSGKPVTTFWRIAGMTYLQYVNTAATAIRGALKEPAQRKAMAQEFYSYKSSVWENGVQGQKVAVGKQAP